jgi:hypothetical protein
VDSGSVVAGPQSTNFQLAVQPVHLQLPPSSSSIALDAWGTTGGTAHHIKRKKLLLLDPPHMRNLTNLLLTALCFQ